MTRSKTRAGGSEEAAKMAAFPVAGRHRPEMAAFPTAGGREEAAEMAAFPAATRAWPPTGARTPATRAWPATGAWSAAGVLILA